MAEEPIPIRRVRRDGEVDLLGEWRASTKELAVDRARFPLTAPGVHKIEGDLPWVFEEMARAVSWPDISRFDFPSCDYRRIAAFGLHATCCR